MNGVGLPAVTVTSPPATCRVITDHSALSLTANTANGLRTYEVTERSRTECTLGPSSNFQSTTGGSWTIASGTITFTGQSDNFVLDAAVLNGQR